ncbi:hypothetical protein FRC17_005762 [Serendipita sp. 399]|nr:hypothetical protein FRC17_005762 [Serendipita sp. 399]
MDVTTVFHVTKPPILLLPIEVLQYIFRIVARQSFSIRNVRRTCRDWRDMVTADNSLPRSIIVLGDVDHFIARNLPTSPPCDYRVYTAADLARGLDHIQDAQFSLYVTIKGGVDFREEWDLVPWHRFQEQCVELYVDPGDFFFFPSLVKFLKMLPVLRNLRFAQIHGMQAALPSALKHLPANNHRLRSLELEIHLALYSSSYVSTIQEFRHVFCELRTLKWYVPGVVPKEPIISLFKSLEKIEELHILCEPVRDDDIDSIRHSVDWKIRPKELHVSTTIFQAFPPSILCDLTILYLSSGYKSFGIDYGVIYLPQLVDLTLVSAWDCLDYFEAPGLKDLHLLGENVWAEYLTHSQRLYPVLVEIGGSEKAKENFLIGTPFPSIVDLHLHIDTEQIGTLTRLAESLLFDPTKDKSLWLPQLEYLLVTLSGTPSSDLEKLQREVSESIRGRPRPVEVGWKVSDKV